MERIKKLGFVFVFAAVFFLVLMLIFAFGQGKQQDQMIISIIGFWSCCVLFVSFFLGANVVKTLCAGEEDPGKAFKIANYLFILGATYFLVRIVLALSVSRIPQSEFVFNIAGFWGCAILQNVFSLMEKMLNALKK